MLLFTIIISYPLSILLLFPYNFSCFVLSDFFLKVIENFFQNFWKYDSKFNFVINWSSIVKYLSKNSSFVGVIFLDPIEQLCLKNICHSIIPISFKFQIQFNSFQIFYNFIFFRSVLMVLDFAVLSQNRHCTAEVAFQFYHDPPKVVNLNATLILIVQNKQNVVSTDVA